MSGRETGRTLLRLEAALEKNAATLLGAIRSPNRWLPDLYPARVCFRRQFKACAKSAHRPRTATGNFARPTVRASASVWPGANHHIDEEPAAWASSAVNWAHHQHGEGALVHQVRARIRQAEAASGTAEIDERSRERSPVLLAST